MDRVFLIMNESFPTSGDIPITEIVPPAWLDYQSALGALSDIAADSGLSLQDGESSVYLPVKGTHLDSDEYYIIELEVSDE